MDVEGYRAANLATMKKLLTDFTPGESGKATFGNRCGHRSRVTRF